MSRKLSPRRRILGAEWTVPEKPIPYPRNRNEAAKAPWPWQVELALSALLHSSVPRFDSKNESPEEFAERCGRWYEVCLSMPVGSRDEALKFFLLSRLPVQHLPMTVLARWYQLALDPDMGLYSSIAAEMQNRQTKPRSSPAPAAAARVFFEDILKYNSAANKWGRLNLQRMIKHMKSHRNATVRSGFYNDGAVSSIRTQLRKIAFGSRPVPKR